MDIKITFDPAQKELAQRISDDLRASHLRLDGRYLIVLVTPELVADDAAITEIESAQANGYQVVPAVLQPAELPPQISALPPVDLSKYRKDKLRVYLRKVDITPNVKRRNRLLTVGLVAAIAAVFIWAVTGLATGQMGPPHEEFATEYAVQQAMIDEMVQPTLEGFMPRSTGDAEGFPQTVEAVTTRVQPYLRQTATAQAASIQATQAAISTSAVQTQTAGE